MRVFFFLTLILFAAIAHGQSPCEKVKLYDQIIVKGDQPTFQKMKRFDKRLIPDSTLLRIKNEVTRYTSPEFYAQLKIKSVKLFDSAVARAWSWTHPPISDKDSNPVYYFYSIVFETVINNKTPFAFRLDFLKNGELLNEKQIAFFRQGKMDIFGCKEIVALILKDTIQPISSIEDMYLAYSTRELTVVWTIAATVDPRTGIQYFKDVNAFTGEIINRSFSDVNAPAQLEELKVGKDNLTANNYIKLTISLGVSIVNFK